MDAIIGRFARSEQCRQFLDDRMQDVPATDVQLDVVSSFVGAKEKTGHIERLHLKCPVTMGDNDVFTAIDRDTKLLACFHGGKREGVDTQAFAHKVAGRISRSRRLRPSRRG